MRLPQLDSFRFLDPEESDEELLTSASSSRGHEDDITRLSSSLRKLARMSLTSSLLELGGMAHGVICSGAK